MEAENNHLIPLNGGTAMRKRKQIDKLVRGRAPVQQNQTGSGKHGDRRTRRNRDRSAQNRSAIEESSDE